MRPSPAPPRAETPEEIRLYPQSDGIPLESENHRRGMNELVDAARDVAEARGDSILAGANLFIYHVEGDPTKAVGPDFFVVRDVSSTPARRVYKIWSEGKGPELVVELASPSSARIDLGRKKRLYESLGVLEYLVFDAEELGWDPPLVAFRRRDERLEPESIWLPDGSLGYWSEVLRLEFRPQGEFLRLWDRETGDFVPTRRERADAERERADAERERADAAVARANSASAEARDARRRADAERERADLAQERAEEERDRADRLEAELARLRAGRDSHEE